MAITFIQQKRRQRYIVWALAGVILIGIIFLWQTVLKPKPAPLPAVPFSEISKKAKKIEIDLGIFNNPTFQALEKFEEFPYPKEKIGRGNPFIPY